MAPRLRAMPEDARRLRLGGLRGSLPWTLPLLVYVLLCLGGVTQSSLGALHEGSSNEVAHQIGHPQPIRSDEFMTQTPIWLGWMVAGGRSVTDPLSVPPNFFAQLPSGPVSSVVFFDGTFSRLGPWLPDAMLFAARWWLPTLLLVLGLPSWFRQITGSRRWGWVATALIFFAPSNQWWSGQAVNTLGFLFAGAALMLHAQSNWARGRRPLAALEVLAAAVLIARFPAYYLPFAIVLGVPVLVGTALYLVRQPVSRAARWVAIGATAALSAALGGATMLESRPALRAALDTVYPGHRVSTGMREPWGLVFGGPVLAPLSHMRQSITGTNASEASSAFTVLLIVALLVLAGSTPLRTGWRGGAGTRGLAATWFGFAALWLSWCLIDWGSLGSRLPVLKMVPPNRAAAVVGFLAIIAFCLTMALVRRPSLPVAVAAGTVASLASALAGWSWRHHGIPLGIGGIAVSSTVAAMVIAAAVRWPTRMLPLVALGLAAAAVTVDVNPVIAGLGDLRGGRTANAMIAAGREARSDHTVWASDTPAFDALMFATGTPALSSRQQLGPDRAAWKHLDPDGSHAEIWNRGGSYLRFRWTDAPSIDWSNPTHDQVLMRVSPCALAQLEPRLSHIASRKLLDLPCLRPTRSLQWGGLTEHVYAVR